VRRCSAFKISPSVCTICHSRGWSHRAQNNDNDDEDDDEDEYEEDEEGNEYPIEIEDKENLLYFLNLLKNAEHKINREEIKDYRSALKLELY
jgi:hypothetical protein